MSSVNERVANATKSMLPTNEQFANIAKDMFPMNEQLANAVKAGFEAQLSVLTTLTTKAIESMEQVIHLNVNAAKATLEESATNAKQLLDAKDPQEFLSLTVAQAQPTAAKAIAYSRHLANIATTSQIEISRAAEEQVAATGRKVSAWIDEVSKNAPAGSENMMTFVKSAINNTSEGYKQLTKTTEQAAGVMEANLTTAVTQISKAAEQTSSAIPGTSRRKH
jgi:phasin family protein